MAKKVANSEDISFEDSLNELESIVKLLEEGNLNLDESLKNFERGITLSRICSQKLEQAEKKIEILMLSEQGQPVLKPAGITEGNDE